MSYFLYQNRYNHRVIYEMANYQDALSLYHNIVPSTDRSRRDHSGMELGHIQKNTWIQDSEGVKVDELSEEDIKMVRHWLHWSRNHHMLLPEKPTPILMVEVDPTLPIQKRPPLREFTRETYALSIRGSYERYDIAIDKHGRIVLPVGKEQYHELGTESSDVFARTRILSTQVIGI